MADEGNNIVTYIFTGEEERNERGRYIIPQNATHLMIHESVTAIPSLVCRNIIELICHDGVERIDPFAFCGHPNLKRVIIPGVKVVEMNAFEDCEALTYVECPKLEDIAFEAFLGCESLIGINLPSAKIVGEMAFQDCRAMTEAKFGNNLGFHRSSTGMNIGYIRGEAFMNCRSLERITLPLKIDWHIADDFDIFCGCENLERVDLVEEAVLHDTVAALLLENWKKDMNEEIDSINHILPNASAGERYGDPKEKTISIRDWIERVLNKIIKYKAKHCRLLNKATLSLELVLPSDIVMNNVVPFLELPLHIFDGEDGDWLGFTALALESVLPGNVVMNYIIPFLELKLHTFGGEDGYRYGTSDAAADDDSHDENEDEAESSSSSDDGSETSDGEFEDEAESFSSGEDGPASEDEDGEADDDIAAIEDVERKRLLCKKYLELTDSLACLFTRNLDESADSFAYGEDDEEQHQQQQQQDDGGGGRKRRKTTNEDGEEYDEKATANVVHDYHELIAQSETAKSPKQKKRDKSDPASTLTLTEEQARAIKRAKSLSAVTEEDIAAIEDIELKGHSVVLLEPNSATVLSCADAE